MTEYYENGPEGMPRVERMTRSTIMAVLSQKDVPTIYVSREEDYNSLCKFAHAVAEETLARVPAWPVERSLSAQDEVLTDQRIIEICAREFNEMYQQTSDSWIVAFARALLAAAPAPIQQIPTAWCTNAHFEAWCERHDMRKDRGDHRQMFDDAASLYLTVPATPPALAGSQVQAAGDARDAARYRWLRDKARSVDWTRNLSPNSYTTACRNSANQMDTAIDAAMREQQP